MVGLLCLTDVDIGEKGACVERYMRMCVCMSLCVLHARRSVGIPYIRLPLLYSGHSTLLLLLHLHSAPQGLLFGASTTHLARRIE